MQKYVLLQTLQKNINERENSFSQSHMECPNVHYVNFVLFLFHIIKCDVKRKCDLCSAKPKQ